MELFGDLQGLKRDKKEKLRGVNPMALISKPNFVPPRTEVHRALSSYTNLVPVSVQSVKYRTTFGSRLDAPSLLTIAPP